MSSSIFTLNFSHCPCCHEIRVKDVIEKWENKSIESCVLGISKNHNRSYKLHEYSHHSSLLLLNEPIDYDLFEEEYINEKKGILIEYGNFSPDMSDEEKFNTDKGLTIYRYGEKGGLRYSAKKYGEFVGQYADIGYIDLNIEKENQKTFEQFINNIAKIEDNKWIKANYSNNFNSHTFIVDALKELKPYFKFLDINPHDIILASKKNANKKLDFIPYLIKNELMNYFKK